MMKKNYTSIKVIALIVFLCLVIITVFLVIDKRNKEDDIVISNTLLEEYLTYVPDDNVSNSAYINKEFVNESANYTLMLGCALNELYSDEEIEIKSSSLDEVLKRRYNITVDSLDLVDDEEDYIVGNNGICYSYYENIFYPMVCGSSNYEKVDIIEDYSIEDDELIIYEYAVSFWTYYEKEGFFIGDYYKTIKDFDESNSTLDLIELDSNNYQDALEDAKTYLEENKNKFTLYKHIFKENSTGYYWYKTIVV